MKRKKIFCILFILIFIILFSVSGIYAQGSEKQNKGNETVFDIDKIAESLPQEIRDILPEGLDTLNETPEKISELFSVEYIFDLSSGLLKTALSAAIRTFAFIATVLLISSLISGVGNSFSQSGSGIRVWNLASSLCIAFCVYTLVGSHLKCVSDFSKNTVSFMRSLTAAMSTVCISAGEISSAGTNAAWSFLLTGSVEEMCDKLLIPIMQISFCATLTQSVTSGVNIGRFVQTIRNTFTSLLVFLMTVISVILSFQSVIAHSTDSVAMRSVRYAITHSVPIIGGLVSDSARTLASSFTLMKNSVGFFGVAVILVLSLYPLVGLFASKLALQMGSAFSSVINEDSASSFMDESVKMINFLIAVTITVAVAFIFCVSVFAIFPASGA